ncbi:MAG: universal stress protein [Verrucomicrobia bacterium]|nr:MAG: universal stress protein [Verrucomicrobiota bacterium]
MFKHILVPLDGSAPAEAALPAAAFLAAQGNARVTLLHIIERDAPATIHGARHLRQCDEACAYLDEIRQRAFAPEAAVTCHVHEAAFADVARGIVEHEDELAPDLIVLCAHGSRGLRERIFGRIAQQVVGMGRVPVLLIHPPASGAAAFDCRRILVPEDGQAEHEIGLQVAADLARATAAQLELLFVVPTTATLSGSEAAASQLLPGATRVMLNLAELGARQHLQQHLITLVGVQAQAHVLRGDPAREVCATAEKLNADLVVLATHGKAGAEAFWSGSVAAKIIRTCTRPLLLVSAR